MKVVWFNTVRLLILRWLNGGTQQLPIGRFSRRYNKGEIGEEDWLDMIIPALGSAQFDEYVTHARQRDNARQQQMQERQQAGLEQAKVAADLLRQEFGVKEVFLFGSLLSPERIHPESDIDLAVWGLNRDRYCEAVGTLLCTVKGFNVDLIILETASGSLLNCVNIQGVRL